MAFNFYHNAYRILIVCFFTSFAFSTNTPVIYSISVINRTLVHDKDGTASRIYLKLEGVNFGAALKLRPTLVVGLIGDECVDDKISKNEFTVVWSNDTSMVVNNEFEEPFPYDELTFCILCSESNARDNLDEYTPKWLNQGSGALFRTRWFSDDSERSILQQVSTETKNNNSTNQDRTMETKKSSSDPPKDKYMTVYFIIMIHGIGILTPWNMFITAKDYFQNYKLSKDYMHSAEDATFYATYFMTFLAVFGQIPNVAFNWLNMFIHLGGNLGSKVLYAIIFEVIVFLFTEFLAFIDTSKWPNIFFWITMVSVFFLNVASGIYQNTIYGITAQLPPAYMGSLFVGANLSGIFAAVISIITKVAAPDLRLAAIFYFLIALFILFICFDTYLILPYTEFYKYYDQQFQKVEVTNQSETAAKTSTAETTTKWEVFKGCWLQCFNVFYIFFISLTLFPSVQSAILSTNPDNFLVNADYFVDITCFLTFNVFATIGSFLTNFIIWPGPKKLHIPVLLRTIFVPLFLFCNYTVKDRRMPVYISNDYVYWVIGMLLALTSGYWSSLAMMYCGKSVPAENSSTAGMLGAACLVTGIFLGIVVAFIWPTVVRL